MASMGPAATLAANSVASEPMHAQPPSPASLQQSTPTFSILLNNPRRATVSGPSPSESPSSEAGPSRLPLNAAQAAPVVRSIPAVPSEKEVQRIKERKERERAKQREERERKEQESIEAELAMEIQRKEEKVWGIPKKAFYLGLGSVPGSLNFNAHMAMMAGWGNGSGGPTDFIVPPVARSKTKKHRRSASGRSLTPHERKTTTKARQQDEANASGSAPQVTQKGDDEDEEKLDPEELAALNAIINTRRSMAAAQALASGEVRLPAPKRPLRPPLQSLESGSNKSNSMADTAEHDDATLLESEAPPDVDEKGTAKAQELPRRPSDASAAVSEGGCPDNAPRIRFAPLPSCSPIDEDEINFSLGSAAADGGGNGDALTSSDAMGKRRQSRRSLDSEGDAFDSDDTSEDSDEEDSDIDIDGLDDAEWDRKMRKAKGKWYLMGLPPQAFKTSEYYRAWKRWSNDHAAAAPTLGNGQSDRAESIKALSDDEVASAHRKPGLRRTPSTESALGRGSASFESERADGARPGAASSTASLTSSDKDEKDDKSKPKHKRKRRHRRSGNLSRSGSVRSGSLSGDEDERLRRRQLILAARPGGTGMVTLPDGTRVKARRVGDVDADGDDPQDWGFAGLASRQRIEPADLDDTGALKEDASQSPDKEDEFKPEMDQAEDGDALSESNAGAPFSADRAAEMRRRHEDEVAALGAEVLAAHRRRRERASGGGGADASSATQTDSMDKPAASDSDRTKSSDPSHPEDGGESVNSTDHRDRHTPSSSPALAGGSRLPSSPQSSLRAIDSTPTRRKMRSSSELYRHQMRGNSQGATSFYSPDITLPRKPDGRGFAVVALPSELGVRPSRPREGRVWDMSDDDDDDDLSDDNDETYMVHVDEGSKVDADEAGPGLESSTLGSGRRIASTNEGNAAGDEAEQEESEDEEMNAAEIAEDERRRAVHSKRATTSAAGMERMHVRARSASGAQRGDERYLPLRRSTGLTQGSNASGASGGSGGTSRTPHRRSSHGSTGQRPGLTMTSANSADDELDSTTDTTQRPKQPVRSRSSSNPSSRERADRMSQAKFGMEKLTLTESPSRQPTTGSSISSTPLSSPSNIDYANGRSPERDPLDSHTVTSRAQKNGNGGEVRRLKSFQSHRTSPSIADDLIDLQAANKDEDLDMWPSSVGSTLGVSRGRRPSASVLQAQMERGRSLRSQRDRERREAELKLRRQQEKDDDALDYGWPPTLKGSLYDR